MDTNEKKILFIIRFTPILVISISYVVISLFIYINSYELFEKYFKDFLILSIIIICISLYFSYQLTNFLEKSFLKYQNKIFNDIEENKLLQLVYLYSFIYNENLQRELYQTEKFNYSTFRPLWERCALPSVFNAKI